MSLSDFLDYGGEQFSPPTSRKELAILRLKRMKARKYNPIIDAETRLRIRISIYAYAYEYEAVSLISDGEFDEMCYQVDLSVNTRRSDLDTWFRKNFDPCTGQWIHKHPELNKIKSIYNTHYKQPMKEYI